MPRMIASYGRTEQPDLWQPTKAYQLKLQQIDSLLQQLQKQRSALLCQQAAFTAGGMMDKEVKQFLQTAISHLDKQVTKLENRMEAIIQEHQGQMADNITSVPGIGKKTAIVLMVLSDCFTRFSHYKQLSAYVGLSPRIYESTFCKGFVRNLVTEVYKHHFMKTLIMLPKSLDNTEATAPVRLAFFCVP